ncbi:MAG: hypothetical protein OXB94_06955, partial [Nitrospira sp.]|nr:hypothetical protein [Nitrospira sp.]
MPGEPFTASYVFRRIPKKPHEHHCSWGFFVFCGIDWYVRIPYNPEINMGKNVGEIMVEGGR